MHEWPRKGKLRLLPSPHGTRKDRSMENAREADRIVCLFYDRNPSALFLHSRAAPSLNRTTHPASAHTATAHDQKKNARAGGLVITAIINGLFHHVDWHFSRGTTKSCAPTLSPGDLVATRPGTPAL